MKANELRIGNCIKDGNDIEQVTIDYLNCLNIGRCEFDAIPLTEEWLLKFGFNYWEGLFVKNNLFLFKDKDCYKAILKDVSFSDGIKIQHVHQLQNLYFALTDDELTIKK